VLVCHCHRVTDARVDAVLAAGASTVRAVVKATHAGTGCGGCLPALRALCDEAASRRACAVHADEALAG
jgi:bacterioferritin-associated ferredoxin